MPVGSSFQQKKNECIWSSMERVMSKIINKGQICQHQRFSWVFMPRIPYFVLFVCFYVFLVLFHVTI